MIDKAFRRQVISVCLRMIYAYDDPPASAPLLRVAIGRNVDMTTAWLMVDHVSSLTQCMLATFAMAPRFRMSAKSSRHD